MSIELKLVTLTLAMLPALASAQATEGNDLKDYLVDINGGVVGAHEILGLPASVVSSIQTPKDFVAALNTASGDAGKAGFGISFTPARSGFRPMAVSIGDYSNESNLLTRLWGGTTLSYAQGSKTIDGTDYRQMALAVQVSYYLTSEDDPSIAARTGFANCAQHAMSNAEFLTEVDKRWQSKMAAKGGSQLSGAEIAALKTEVENEVKAENASSGLFKALRDSKAAAKKCVSDAYKQAKAKWNKSLVGLTLGQGWIRGPAGGLERTSLGRHAALTLAWAPRELENSLFNLTVRRVDRELDTSTLGGTPSFKSSSLAAARYTYGYGDDQDTYLIAEVSNAKASKMTEANAAFKSAFGLDRKIGEGMWLELRVGRSRAADSGKLESKALFNLKLSPEAKLPKMLGG